MVQGTTAGIATDIDGKYSLSVTGDNPVLEISCIGYITQVVPVNGRSVINVILEEESTELDETLVIGYAVGNKRSVSGTVEKVTAEKLNKGYISDAIEALAGNVPGLLITTNGGTSTPIFSTFRGYLPVGVTILSLSSTVYSNLRHPESFGQAS